MGGAYQLYTRIVNILPLDKPIENCNRPSITKAGLLTYENYPKLTGFWVRISLWSLWIREYT